MKRMNDKTTVTVRDDMSNNNIIINYEIKLDRSDLIVDGFTEDDFKRLTDASNAKDNILLFRMLFNMLFINDVKGEPHGTG